LERTRPDMTPLDELICRRRSIRKYRPDIPPESWVRDMVRAASRAPSPSNGQPVRFIRLASAGTRHRLRQAMEEGRVRLLRAIQEKDAPRRLKNWVSSYYRFSEFMFHAPILVAVAAAHDSPAVAERLSRAGVSTESRQPDRDRTIAVGLALKGFLLKGEDLGLGACILTAPLLFIENPERLLGLGEMEILCFVAAGYPDEEPAWIERKEITEIYREL